MTRGAGSADREPSDSLNGSMAPRDELMPLRIRLQGGSVEEPQVISYPRRKVCEILEGKRFIVTDGSSTGFSEEEKKSILESPVPPFNAKLNVCIFAEETVSCCEEILGRSLPWPRAYFTHYLNEADRARDLMQSPATDERLKEKYGDFVTDLSRDMTSFRGDDRRVFITIAPSPEARMPTFNVAKLQITLQPYPSRGNSARTINPGELPDDVAHESGHLLHSALRPGWDDARYNDAGDFETCSLREASADLSALFLALGNEHICRRVIDETQGDMRMSNCASRISEEGGGDLLRAYFDEQGVEEGKRYLRDLVNPYTYVERDKAPTLEFGMANAGMLFNDVYSYSQVFSGAIYDIMDALYRAAPGEDRAGALMSAARTTAGLLARGTELSRWWRPDFNDLARCVIEASRLDDRGVHQDIVKKVFLERKILTSKDLDDMGKDARSLPVLALGDLPQDLPELSQALQKRGLLPEGEDITCTLKDRYGNDRGETFLNIAFEKPYRGDSSETTFDLSTAIMADICDLTPDIRERGSLLLKFDQGGRLFFRNFENYHRTDLAQRYLKIVGRE